MYLYGGSIYVCECVCVRERGEREREIRGNWSKG